MLTLNYIKEKNYPIDYVLSFVDKAEIILENKDKNYSYLCLLKEMFAYRITVSDLHIGWGGVKIFEV